MSWDAMPDGSHQTPRTIDYAPPPRRPWWLSGRIVSLLLLTIAAGLSVYVVVPRVWQRAELLRAQNAMLAGQADMPRMFWSRHSASVDVQDQLPNTFLNRALGQPGSMFAYGAGREAMDGLPQRLVLVQARFYAPDTIALTWHIVVPATWTRQAELLAFGTNAYTLFDDADYVTLVPAPLSPGSAIVLIAEAGKFRENPSAPLDETARSPDPPTQRVRITISLLPNDYLVFNLTAEPLGQP